MNKIITVLIIFLLIQCTATENKKVSFISMDIYPALAMKSSILFNLNTKEIYIKPIGEEALELPLPPPNPEVLEESIPLDTLRTRLIKLDTKACDTIQLLIEKLTPVDLESVYNHTFKDGLGMRIDIVYKNLSFNKIILINDATKNQRMLIKYLLELVMKNSVKNKNYFNKILSN